MKRLLYMPVCLSFLSLPLIACYGGERYNTGECPAGETCSDLTPTGLKFIGNSLYGELLLSGPRPTAIGGTQAIALQYERNDGVDIALDLPFTADDDGGIGVKVDAISGSQVIVRGAGSRSNYLRILDSDGLLMDRKELTGAALKLVELVPADYESVPANTDLAFAAGTREFGVALYGDVQTSSGPTSQRLIDTSMQLALAGSTRKAWDMLQLTATVGTSTLAVTAGDKPTANLDIVVVDHADSVSLISPAPATIAPNTSESVCFQALASGRYIAGLTWTYVIDGASPIVKGDGTLTRNCISVSTQKTSGTVSVQASAGGQTTAMALTVGAMARESKLTSPAAAEPTTRALSHAVTTAGDRAAM
ncbi:MAG TPA: hypothetical protein VIV40_34170 [Kofleriaceae bacterium]